MKENLTMSVYSSTVRQSRTFSVKLKNKVRVNQIKHLMLVESFENYSEEKIKAEGPWTQASLMLILKC